MDSKVDFFIVDVVDKRMDTCREGARDCFVVAAAAAAAAAVTDAA
jgi:hypothetical protein